MKKRTLGVLALGGIAALCALALLVFIKLDLPTKDPALTESSPDAIERIRALSNAGAYRQAYLEALLALENDPDQPNIALHAGHLAVILKNPENAAEHMQQAWDLGERKLSALLVIVDHFQGSKGEKIALFDKLFASIEQSPQHLNAKARFYSQVGEHEEALLIWRALHKENPSEGVILQIARKLEVIGDRDKAIAFLEQQNDLGLLADEGTNLLCSLLLFDNQFKKAFELSNTYEAVDPHGEWQLKKAIFSILSGDLAESENRLEALKKAPSNHTIAITVAHESRLFLALVRVILHGQQANFHDLYSILSQELKNVPPVTLPTPLLGLRVSQKQIEGERIFYQFLENSQSSGSSENSSFSRISSLLGNSPVLTWIGLRHYLTQGKASDAVSLYQGLESMHPLARVEGLGGSFYKSPLFLIETARAYELNNQPRQSLAILAHMHSREVYTRDSILLYSKVAKSVDENFDGANVERVLNHHYKDDLNFQLMKVRKSLEANNHEAALEQIRVLAMANPDSLELQMMYLMTLLRQGEIAELGQQLESSTIPQRSKYLVKARIALQNGSPEEAEQLFLQAMDDKDQYGYLDYARFLVMEGRGEEATALYQQILGVSPKSLTALHGLAIIQELVGQPSAAILALQNALNIDSNSAYTRTRLAKVYLQLNQTSDALWELEKVLSRDPKDSDAASLKVVAMTLLAQEQSIPTLKEKKLDEAAKYLSEFIEEFAETPQPDLQLIVAAGYRDHGFPDKAAQIYNSILALDSTFWSTTSLKREDIETALKSTHE